MKRAILVLTLFFSFNLYAEDQKAMMYGSAAASLAGSGMTTIAGLEYSTVCAAGETAVVTAAAASIACWKAGLAYTTAALTAGMAGLSFATAEDMDTSDGKAALPSSVNTHNVTTPSGAPVKTPADLRNAIDAQKDLVNQKLADLKAQGYDMDKFLANPEAHGVSQEQLKQMQAEVGQTGHKGESLEFEKSTKTAANEISYESNYSRDIASGDASGSGIESPNFDTLFSNLMPKGASENSAPGYYGNVPLKVLNPGSKMTLFERVSSKLKKFSM